MSYRIALEPGALYGVGVGPGDPGLVTRRAWAIAQSAPVVASVAALDADGAPRESRARATVAEAIRGDAEDIRIEMPMRADGVAADRVYDQAAETIAARLNDGLAVAALCEGDPLFYGSFMYLLNRLAPRFPVHVTPGVPSFAAAAAALRAPLVARAESFAVIPATLPDAAIEARLASSDAAALIKIGRHGPRLRALLERVGRLDGARLVEEASGAGERTAPFADPAADRGAYFALVLAPAARRETAA